MLCLCSCEELVVVCRRGRSGTQALAISSGQSEGRVGFARLHDVLDVLRRKLPLHLHLCRVDLLVIHCDMQACRVRSGLAERAV